MAGLPWFELDTDFADDPKIAALKARLREPLADAYVARLYAYCYKHVRDRFDPDVAQEIIEGAVKWKGRRGGLFNLLARVGILEREAGKVVVHGVKERLAPHVASRVAAAARQKRRRDKVAQSIEKGSGVTRDVQRDVTRDSRRTSRPALSMSMSVSSQCESRSLASDGTGTETVPTDAAAPPAAPLNGNGLDAEALALLRLLPAKAVDVATSLGLPRGAVDSALEELRGRGLVRLSSGMVPQWERA